MSHTNNARRDFLKSSVIIGAGLMAGTAYSLEPRQKITIKNIYPFFNTHQQGITSPAQHHIYFIVLDLHSQNLDEIKQMFKTWTAYSQQLTQGKNVQIYSENGYVPAVDTGEADSLNPYNLTLTFGVSPSFFTKLGIEKAKPAELVDLPHFPRDQLKDQFVGGDICIQACADDPQVAFHAVRNLVRVARSEVTMRWSQSGFNSFEGTDTPRNLFGFRDGTGNPQGEELDKTVWYDKDNWLKGGSFLVVRKIQMFLETWDRTSLSEQQNTFGRHRDSGAAYGQKKEFDPVDLDKKGQDGQPLVPEDSHTHIAHKTGLKLLRRSFSYASGIDPRTGQFDAGLLFVSFQKDPQQFITIQNHFGNIDKMNEYITHIGSGLFACFAGVKDENDYLGKALFESL
ncbi:iron uptake transporter deferrochelatase/peroxidase subunit [Lonepinella sp. BR2357]|uniref:iron uptake transporter deferrochelatase/peroxidase subunit n=1 Tax=Lonepinella sp. BR2357 TaxID=3434549 RepID=UPI003F6DDC16